MARRSYEQFCPVAVALDWVGERWTLLIVRELLLGPQRFSDLLDALPGLGTSLLSDRLRKLAAAGFVTRDQPSTGSQAYVLTAEGLGLAPVVRALADVGIRLLDEPTEGYRVDLAVLHMASSIPPEAVAGLRESYEIRIDDVVVHIRIDAGSAMAGVGPAPWGPDVVVETGDESFLDLYRGRTTLPGLETRGLATVSGGTGAADRARHLIVSPVTTGCQREE